jgi:hypothetical protein
MGWVAGVAGVAGVAWVAGSIQLCFFFLLIFLFSSLIL